MIPKTSTMPRVSLFLLSMAMLPVLGSGCADEKFTATVLNPLNLELPFVPYQEPVRIGIVHEHTGVFDPATWDFAKVGSPWTPMSERLQKRLGQPVQFIDLEPFQVAAHLQSGRLDFAFLSAGDYTRLVDEFGDLGEVLAISDGLERQGLIVARADSSVQTLADVAGKRFSFGPSNDPVLDLGAKQALEHAGVSLDSIQKEIIPIPNTYQNHISSKESAKEIAYGLGTEVGVIEKSEYDAYPDTGGSALLVTFSKEKFRVLGATEPVAVDTIESGPFIASKAASPELVEQVRDFLLTASRHEPRVLSVMGLAAFKAPSSDTDAMLRESSKLKPVHLVQD